MLKIQNSLVQSLNQLFMIVTMGVDTILIILIILSTKVLKGNNVVITTNYKKKKVINLLFQMEF